MTLTRNDPIELLKVILKEYNIGCIVLIISLIVADWTILISTFNAVELYRILFALSQFSCSFY